VIVFFPLCNPQLVPGGSPRQGLAYSIFDGSHARAQGSVERKSSLHASVQASRTVGDVAFVTVLKSIRYSIFPDDRFLIC
jgi:hypothetical protein